MKKPVLSVDDLKREVRSYLSKANKHSFKELFGTTDGKAIGTYVEQEFRKYLGERYSFQWGNSASGIDFPSISTDLKVTSITQPQSSCPYKSANQKVYGLGYNLIVFVYKKKDDSKTKTAKIHFLHGIFIDNQTTSDFQTTSGINGIIGRNGNADDIIA